MAGIVDIFPRRPIKLANVPGRAKRRIMLLVLAALLALPALYWGNKAWQSQSLRQDMRARGVEAASVSDSKGDCTSRRQRLSGSESPIGCEVTLTYELRPEEGGGTRTATLHLDGRMPIFTPRVYYDPANPDRAMLKPEVDRELSWSETIGPAFLLLLPAIALAFFFFGGRRGLAKAAADPKPLTVPIEKVMHHQNKLYVHSRPPGAERAVVDAFTNPATPLLVRPPDGAPEGQQWALALMGAKRPYLLDSQLADLDLTEAERSDVLGAAWA